MQFQNNHNDIELKNLNYQLINDNYSPENQKQNKKEQSQNNQEQDENAQITIKILTYNIFLRPPPVKHNKDDYKNERTNLFLDIMKDFDIICLQEVFGLLNNRKSRLIFESMYKGFYYHAQSPDPSFFSYYMVDGGLLTLSKYPIEKIQYKNFAYGIRSDLISQKGVLYTKIQIKNAYLHLFNTHLQATYDNLSANIKKSIYKARIDQMTLIRDFAIKMLKENNYVSSRDICFIIGDFNVNSLGKIYDGDQIDNYQNIMTKCNKNQFHEYTIIKEIVRDQGNHYFQDLVRETFNDVSPITYGDVYLDENGKEIPSETALTVCEDLKSKQSLDYIFQFIPNYQQELNKQDYQLLIQKDDQNKYKQFSLQFLKNSVQVEKFLVDDKNLGFTQLSDHYGLSGQIIFKQNTNEDKN